MVDAALVLGALAGYDPEDRGSAAVPPPEEISPPSGLAADGLPLGVQLVGAPFAEARLLAAARWVEAALGFAASPLG